MSRPEHISPLHRLGPARVPRALVSPPARTWRRDSLRRRLLAAADVLASTIGAGAVLAAGGIAVEAVVLVVPFWIVLAKLYGLYDRDHRALRHLTSDEVPVVLGWALAGIALTTTLTAPLAAHSPSPATLAGAWAVAAAATLALRSAARWSFRRVAARERALIVGDGPLADATRRKLALFDDIHVSVLDDAEPELKEFAARARIPAGVDRVIVASHELDERSLAALVAACRSAHVKLTVVPPTRGAFGTAVELRHIADLPVIEYHTWDVSRSTLLLKRLLDLVVASAALIVLLPLFALIAAAVKLDSRGPVLFTQSRAGVDGRPFRMLKFRTMVADAEAILPTLVQLDRLEQPVFKLADDPRVTRAGRFLRRASLDELPQLVNVLLGQMSLVGPRPEQVEVVERYRPEHRFRLLVKPGLTGPMQVYGRGALGFDERLALEREYIENLSFGRDLRLLALTVRAVSGGTGAF